MASWKASDPSALYDVGGDLRIQRAVFAYLKTRFRLGKNILAVATMTSNIFLAKQTGYFCS